MREAFEGVSKRFHKFIEEGKALAAKQITARQLDEFLVRLELERANEREESEAEKRFKRTEKYRSLVSNFETAPGAKEAGHTLWGALNAVTYYVDHQATSRVTSAFTNKDEARLNSAWFNGGNDKKQNALALALAMAK